jgi:hypothetical protein
MITAFRWHAAENFAVSRQAAKVAAYTRETPYIPYIQGFLRVSDPIFSLHLPYLIGLIEPYILNEKSIY